MPIYVYTCEGCGVSGQLYASVAERNHKQRCDCGSMMARDWAAEHEASFVRTGDPWAEHKSLALAIPASQRAEWEKEDGRRGVPVDYVPDGSGMCRPRFRSKIERGRYMAAYGWHDKDGFD